MATLMLPQTASSTRPQTMGRARSTDAALTLPGIRGAGSVGGSAQMRMRRTRSASYASDQPGSGLGGSLPLPIGPAMNRLLLETSSSLLLQVRRQMDLESPLRTREISELKEQKRREAGSMSRWLKAKAAQKRAEHAAKVAAGDTMELKMAAIQEKNAKSAAAYAIWLEKKEAREYAAMVKAAVGEENESSSFTLEEIRNVVQKVCPSDEMFEAMNAFFTSASGASQKPMHQDDIMLLFAQAVSGVKVDIRVEQMVKEETNGTQGELMSKDALTNLKVRNKIGDQILSTLCSGRTLFGHAIKTVHDIFHAADTDGSNSLDKEEFRDVCDRLDLGIPTAQMQELWAAFDLDGDGTISGAEFEGMLINVEAVREMRSPTKKTEAEAVTADLLKSIGERKLKTKITEIFEVATEFRLDEAIASEDNRQIHLLELKAALRKVLSSTGTEYDLKQAQKSNLIQVFEQLFRKLDKKKAGRVAIDDLLFFVRTSVMRLNAQVTHTSAAAQKDKIAIKIGKIIIKEIIANWKGKAPEVGQVNKIATEMMETFDPHARGQLSKTSIMKGFFNLGFSLSVGQQDTLFLMMDGNGNGKIDIQECSAFLKKAANKMLQEEKEKKDELDPRSNIRLITMMTTTVTSDISVLVPVMLDIKHHFQHQQVTSSPKAKVIEAARKHGRASLAFNAGI